MRLHGEWGESLIELMVTIMILGIAVVAIVGAIGGSIIASDAHQNMASGEVVIRDYVEAVKEEGAANTVLCPAVADLTPTFAAAGWTTSIIAVQYWIRDQPNFTGHYGNRTECLDQLDRPGCQLAPQACDPGLQKVTLRALNARTDYGAHTAQTTIELRRGNP
jgi:type II secretory pathway pseudopilin PulG